MNTHGERNCGGPEFSEVGASNFGHLTLESLTAGRPEGASSRPSTKIRLKFGEEVDIRTRARIDYAFRVFAAIYGYTVLAQESEEGGICCIYGASPGRNSWLGAIHLPSCYRPEAPRQSGRVPVRIRYANEAFCLSHGVDDQTGNPDWLGEIFEWISSSHERGISERDRVGRIAYADTPFATQQLSPRKPHAAMLMAWLENFLRHGNTMPALPKAPSPLPGREHLVISSHDIDFYYTSAPSALVRLLKNLVISFSSYRSRSFFFDNVKMIRELLAGRRVGHYLPRLLTALDDHDVRSTLFVVARRGHRRDPRYDLEEIAPHLLPAMHRGFSVGLHASYESVVERSELQSEADRLRDVLGAHPLGNRQHWLRFDRHEKLFHAVETTGLTYDSSLGFADTPGFRNGANFAFPPYNFHDEKPHEFLEIPLVLMDGNVEAASRHTGEPAQEIADEVLGASRAWGWGGCALLWHNPLDPLSVPSEINRVFWNCAAGQEKHREKWVTAEQFLQLCLARYQNAGLMKGARIDA